MSKQITIAKEARRRIALIAGYGLFALGLLGLVLPVLPTTVFWIAAAACFAKSSPAMRRRIAMWPRVGPAVDDFLGQGAIADRSKVVAVAGMGIGFLIAALSLGPGLPLAAAFALIALAAAYVLTRPQPLSASPVLQRRRHTQDRP